LATLPTQNTRNFKDTVKARVERDPTFRKELLREGIEAFLQGDVETGISTAGKPLLSHFPPADGKWNSTECSLDNKCQA